MAFAKSAYLALLGMDSDPEQVLPEEFVPLAASMKKAGIPLGFYYSIMDWHHPDYLPRRAWEKDRTTKGADFGRYMDFATNQIKELVTKYDPAVMWFDGEWEHSNSEQRAFAIGKMLLESWTSSLEGSGT